MASWMPARWRSCRTSPNFPERRLIPRQVERLERRDVPSAGSPLAHGLTTHAEVHRQSSKVAETLTAKISATSSGGVGVRLNIAYEPKGPERLDVYEPPGRAPKGGWPVILAIHGGGWWTTDKSQWEGQVAAQYVPLGYAVVVPNYTLSTPTSPSWPTAFHDVQQALTWTHQHASAYRFNTNRVIALGESAGGELAALLGTVPADPGTTGGATFKVQAVVSFYGPMDMTTLARTDAQVNSKVVQFLGGSVSQRPADYASASPTNWVSPGDPPMLLIHGTADPTVPISQAEEMAATLSASGVPNEFLPVAGAGHAFEFQPEGQALLPDVIAFLKKYVSEPTPSAAKGNRSPHRSASVQIT